MRLAFFSPLNPAPSGISDYAEELLPYLAQYAEIELLVDGYVPTNPALQNFPRVSLAEFYNRAAQYDALVYQMGNSPAHAKIYETLLRYPGVVVMHDVALHHLRAWLTLERGNAPAYLDAMRAAYGERGAQAAKDEIQRQALTDRFEFPLNEEVVRAAKGLIVHSAYAARAIQPLAPTTPLAIIPMGIPLAPLLEQDAARAELQLARNEFIVAAFGEIHPHKRVLPALAAFAQFHAQHSDSRLLLVGRASPLFDVMDAARALHIQDAVCIVGYASREDYARYMAAADVCLNLRYPSAGETSASLLRLFAAARVVFVTATAAMAELPDDICVKIQADAHEQTMLAAYLEFFYTHPDARAALGANARRYVQEHHTLENAARRYFEFLKRLETGD